MRILVHDFSGHPFQAQLSRELSRRGHAVTHSYCEAYTGGKGKLQAEPGEDLVFDPVTIGESIAKLNFAKRSLQELKVGAQLIKQIRRIKPEVVMFSTTPVPSLVVVALYLFVARIPWVLWHQDVQAVAIKSFSGKQLPKSFLVAGKLVEWGERWGSRRANAIVVIADSFINVHREWGTSQKVTVIPNWAPLDEIVPAPRRNLWAEEQDLGAVQTLLYSGTLGMKHNPELLPRLAKAVRDGGTPVRLVVVNEGPAASVVQAEADRLGVPLTLLPFQPYERLSEVLGSGDVLLVLLEQTAGAFSVPSKTLSYLCAGRPVLGMMPAENLASALVELAQGCVVRPEEDAIPAAADWIRGVLADPARAAEVGAASRALAEREFELSGCADRFEEILVNAAG